MKLHEWNARLHGLVIFRSLLSDPVAARFAALIDCLTAGNNSVGSGATPWHSLKACCSSAPPTGAPT